MIMFLLLLIFFKIKIPQRTLFMKILPLISAHMLFIVHFITHLPFLISIIDMTSVHDSDIVNILKQNVPKR